MSNLDIIMPNHDRILLEKYICFTDQFLFQFFDPFLLLATNERDVSMAEIDAQKLACPLCKKTGLCFGSLDQHLFGQCCSCRLEEGSAWKEYMDAFQKTVKEWKHQVQQAKSDRKRRLFLIELEKQDIEVTINRRRRRNSASSSNSSVNNLKSLRVPESELWLSDVEALHPIPQVATSQEKSEHGIQRWKKAVVYLDKATNSRIPAKLLKSCAHGRSLMKNASRQRQCLEAEAALTAPSTAVSAAAAALAGLVILIASC